MKSHFLLHHDGTVRKTKNPIMRLQSLNCLSNVEYLMLKVPYNKDIYMMIDPMVTDNIGYFTKGTINYIMRMRELVMGPYLDEDGGDDGFDLSHYTYEERQIVFTTYEELFAAIHSIFALHTVLTISTGECENTDSCMFIDVTNVAIELYNGKTKIDTFYHDRSDYHGIPFIVEAFDELIGGLKTHYGIQSNVSSMHNTGSVVIYRGPKGTMWRVGKNVELRVNVLAIFYGLTSNTYLHMMADDFDHSLRFTEVSTEIVPILLYPSGTREDYGMPIEMLSPCTRFNITPISYVSEHDDPPSTNALYEDYRDDMFTATVFISNWHPSIITTIEYLRYFIKVYHEYAKVHMRSSDGNEYTIDSYNMMSTVISSITLVVENDTEAPSGSSMMYLTLDPYSKFPTFAELCSFVRCG